MNKGTRFGRPVCVCSTIGQVATTLCSTRAGPFAYSAEGQLANLRSSLMVNADSERSALLPQRAFQLFHELRDIRRRRSCLNAVYKLAASSSDCLVELFFFASASSFAGTRLRFVRTLPRRERQVSVSLPLLSSESSLSMPNGNAIAVCEKSF